MAPTLRIEIFHAQVSACDQHVTSTVTPTVRHSHGRTVFGRGMHGRLPIPVAADFAIAEVVLLPAPSRRLTETLLALFPFPATLLLKVSIAEFGSQRRLPSVGPPL